MKTLLVTFSDNEVHQDITFGMFDSLYDAKKSSCDVWVMGTGNPKVNVLNTPHTHLVDCPKRPGIEKKTFDLKTLFSIIHWINKQRFDTIFFESLHVWNLAIMLFCHKKVRIFQMIHDLIPHEGDRQERFVKILNKIVCRLADVIVLANRKYLKKVTELYGADPDKVRHIELWRRFPDYTFPLYTKRVLFFGRINPYKGIDNLLEIVKDCPEITFDVVGRIDLQVMEYAEKLNAYPNVSLDNGYITDDAMTDYFVNADWVILPYNSATQSGVVIDAYRYGRPCIVFDVGALAEQVEDGISGFLIEPGDNKAFTRKLKEVMKMDKDSYSTLSKASYEYGYKKYAVEEAVGKFLELIHS